VAPPYLKATIRISIVSSRQETWATSARAASSNRALREASKEAGTEVAGTEVAVAGGGVSAPCLGNKAGNPFEQEIAEEAEKDLSPR